MYELVNTSLPNGLISGTHGFATVAMTKGVSEVLRRRLEALCSYTHRTSTHDATYYRQNPVNLFHVILPQGEHAIGRVAPCEFDYTGRTNRLANLRVFAASEMPGIGAAEVLKKEETWFSQKWQGEPRYLDEDRNTCERLRLSNPVKVNTAPAWDGLFGPNGTRFAKQFTRLLEKNVTSGGKSIYFKTSTAFDVSGERLLGLFSDLINLLPVDLRSRVTFSTYPVSLPAGTTCNLKGVYDTDKVSEVSSATQAWVDCENKKIVHPEMLPSLETSKENGTVVNRETNAVSYAVNRSSFVASSKAGQGNSYQNILMHKEQGIRVFPKVLIGISSVVIAAIAGVFVWKIMASNKQIQETRAMYAPEKTEIQNLEPENKEEERKMEERLAREQEERKAEQEKEDDLQRKEAEEKAKRLADDIAAQAAKEESNKKKPVFDFASVQVEGKWPSSNDEWKKILEKNDELRICYYDGSALTNDVVSYKYSKPIRKYLFKIGETKVNDVKAIKKSPLAIWMIGNKAWFDWSMYDNKNKSEQWFKGDITSRDLQVDCFGTSEEIYNAWTNKYPVTYSISFNWHEGEQTVDCPSREFTFNAATNSIYNLEKNQTGKAPDGEDLSKKINDVHWKIVGDNGQSNKVEKLQREVEALKQEIAESEKSKKALEGTRSSRGKTERDTEINRLRGEIPKKRFSLSQKESDLKNAKSTLEQLKTEKEALRQQQEDAEKQAESWKDASKLEAKVRSTLFCVRIKEEN